MLFDLPLTSWLLIAVALLPSLVLVVTFYLAHRDPPGGNGRR